MTPNWKTQRRGEPKNGPLVDVFHACDTDSVDSFGCIVVERGSADTDKCSLDRVAQGHVAQSFCPAAQVITHALPSDAFHPTSRPIGDRHVTEGAHAAIYIVGNRPYQASATRLQRRTGLAKRLP